MNRQEIVYWDSLIYNNWIFHLAATKHGLCCLKLPNEPIETLENWVDKHIQHAELVQNTEKVSGYCLQLKEFLQGRRKKFLIDLDLRGTLFQKSVWYRLMKIPYGETSTYFHIAKSLHNPKSSRAVGAANGSNPIPIIIPCHRVIGSDGKLTGYRGGIAFKKTLLALEHFYA